MADAASVPERSRRHLRRGSGSTAGCGAVMVGRRRARDRVANATSASGSCSGCVRGGTSRQDIRVPRIDELPRSRRRWNLSRAPSGWASVGTEELARVLPPRTRRLAGAPRGRARRTVIRSSASAIWRAWSFVTRDSRTSPGHSLISHARSSSPSHGRATSVLPLRRTAC